MTNNNVQTTSIESLSPRSLKYLANYLQSLVRGRLWLQVMVGMVLGIAVGIALGPAVGWVAPSIAIPVTEWLAFPGKLFLALSK